MEASKRFALGDDNAVIAHELRVSVRSVQRWRKAWSQDGPKAFVSKGSASLPLLSDELLAALEQKLAKGPAARLAGPDLDPVTDQDPHRRRLRKSYTVQGIAALLKRHGWSCQVPARRAAERDEATVAD